MEMPPQNEEKKVEAMEAMNAKNIESKLSEKLGIEAGYLEDFAQTIHDVYMDGEPAKLNIRFGLQQDAINMKKFLQSPEGANFLKESFSVKASNVDRAMDSVGLKLEKSL